MNGLETSLNDFFLSPTGATVLILIVVWSTVWKGLALWRAGRRNDLPWFIIMLLFNTVGILEIIYYFVISNPDEKKKDGKR